MLSITFVSEQVAEIVNGRYHNSSLFSFLERYRKFGRVTTCCYSIVKESSKNKEIFFDDSNQYIQLNKPNNIYRRFFATSYNYKVLEDSIKRSDLVICHLPSVPGNIAVNIAKKYNKPYIIGCVGCIWDSLFNYNWKGKLLAPYEYFKMKKIIQRAPYVFYVTQKFLQQRYPTTGKTIGCSNVDIEIANDEILNQKKEFLTKVTNEINLMTSAAVNVRYKGQQYVIQAMSRLIKEGYNFHYYLAGGGDNSYLRNLATNLGIEKNVHFLGQISRKEIFQYLEKTHCYIQPSKQEGLPRALIEAMSRACPALGSTTAGIPELLPRECLFRANDVNKICHLLKSLNTKKYLELSRINFEKAKLYDRNILNKRRDNFFRTIIESL